MNRALVLSGGGNLGAVQVGMLAALHERGITPDLLVGTSVGALNAAYVAGRGLTADALDELTRVWLRVRRRDVFPIDPVRQLLALAGCRPSLSSSDGLRRLIAGTLPYRMLEDRGSGSRDHNERAHRRRGMPSPRRRGDCGAGKCGRPRRVSRRPVRRLGAVRRRGGRQRRDIRAVALGADEVWVLPAGYACALTRPPAGALAAALHAVSLLTHPRMQLEVADVADRVELHVLPPLCPVSVSPIDFTRTAELIERGHGSTTAWLADGGDRRPNPARFLALHDHSRPDDMAGGCPPHAIADIECRVA